MSIHTVTDYQCPLDVSDAYNNSIYTLHAETIRAGWLPRSEAIWQPLRQAGKADVIAYGTHPRQYCRWLMPQKRAKAFLVYFHGGYWQFPLSPADFTFLAAGGLENDMAVGLVGYRLCPEVSMAELLEDTALGLYRLLSQIPNIPVVLAGHSAGGQIISQLVSTGLAKLAPELKTMMANRIKLLLSISGLHDLRPILHTSLNDSIGLDETSSLDYSPALHGPDWSKLTPQCRLTAWVGAWERAELIRQSQMLPIMWQGLKMNCRLVMASEKNHYTVVDELTQKSSPMLAEIQSAILSS